VRQSLLSAQAFPRERFGDPPEFAHMVAAFVANGFANGTVLRLDAGTRMSKL
jgi:hypothetical protein